MKFFNYYYNVFLASVLRLEDRAELLQNNLNTNFSQQHQQQATISGTNMQISANLLNEYLGKNFCNNPDNLANLNNYYRQYYANIYSQQGNLRINSNNMLNLDALALQSSLPKKSSTNLQNDLSNYFKLKQNEYFYLQQQSNNLPLGNELNFNKFNEFNVKYFIFPLYYQFLAVENNLKIIQNFSNEFLKLYLLSHQQQQSQPIAQPVSVSNDILNKFLNFSKNSEYYTTYLKQYQQTIQQLTNNDFNKFDNLTKSCKGNFEKNLINNFKEEKMSFDNKQDSHKENPFIPYKKRAFKISQDEIINNSDGDSNSVSNETNESVTTVNTTKSISDLASTHISFNTKRSKENKEKAPKKPQLPDQPKKS